MTRDSGISQFIVFQKIARCLVLIDDHNRPVFSFPDSPDLRAHVADYAAGATVPAGDYDRAGAIMRKLIREARYRRSALDRRIIAGLVTVGEQARQTVTDAIEGSAQ